MTWGKKEELPTKQNDLPAVAPETVKTEKKAKKARAIPEKFSSSFTDEEKKIFAKDFKSLTKDEAKKLLDIKIKMERLKGKALFKKIAQREAPSSADLSKMSYAKCIVAEEFLTTEAGKNFLKDLAAKKDFTAKGAESLELLAKSHKMDLKFKVRPKKEA